jgi:glutamine synthetase
MTKDQILLNPPRLTRFCWVDNAGISRGKAVWHVGLEGALRGGVGLTVGQQALPMMFDAVIPETGLSAVGEARIVADLETFTPLSFAPGSAMVLGNMVTVAGEPWLHCPRTFLKSQLLEAQKLGFEVFSSFENEFFLFNNDDTPLDSSNYATLDAFEHSRIVINEMLEALETAGLTPEMYYPEAGTGQQEISIAPSMGVKAADQQVIFKTIVKGVAAKHKLKASFAAKPILESMGSGCHLHVSLWQHGKNVFFDPSDPIKLSKLAYHAIAGVLEHLPALCALTVPSVNSYRRLQPGWWAGAFACYGLDNREASVRVASTHLLPSADANGKSTNFELKTCDASANPYIALGGLIAAMLEGIKRKLEPGEPLQTAPGAFSEAEREARGIVQLPKSLSEAIANLERDELLLAALGGLAQRGLAQSFIAVRKAEAAYFLEHPDEEIAKHRYVY